MGDFTIAASLTGHDDDVRGVLFASPSNVVSCSRDATVRFWTLTEPSSLQFDDTVAFQGSAFINAVAFAPPSSSYPEGLIISAGKDAIIDVRQPGHLPDANAERMLLGHAGNICALDVCQEGSKTRIVSGSWDCSARIWDVELGETLATLEDHEASVWDVMWYKRDIVVTACADQNIRIFSSSGKLLKKFKAGDDVVRALCKLPDNHSSGAAFASGGNDGIVRLWTMEGIELAQLQGHSNFIYSLVSLPSGEIASSSEDRTVKIWRNGSCVQTITHPAISVWSVAASANGDIVTGASDKIVRIFSRSADRVGDPDTVKAFEEAVKGSSIPKQQMGEINKESLPGPDFLSSKSGTKEGQVQLIQESNGNISAHTWSAAAQKWTNVGTVVDAAGSSGRKAEFMGQNYDYVFDVDIEEGKPPLKLPYNVSQNPYEVAQQWIANHELPMTYLDQVANFIITNTQGASIGTTSDGPGADPWGSDRRYRPGDPASTGSVPKTLSKSHVIPQKEYLTITQASFTIILKKVTELNQELLKEGHKDEALNPTQLEQLPILLRQLDSVTTVPMSGATADALEDAVIKIVTAWPEKMRLPGFDLLRCLTSASEDFTDRHDITQLLQHSKAFTTQNANTAMLGIRALANLFGNAKGRTYANHKFGEIFSLASPFAQASSSAANRNVHIALTTLYIDLAVLLLDDQSSNTPALQKAQRAAAIIADLTALLGNSKIMDSETIYRALVAVGTLLTVPFAEGVKIDSAALQSAVKRASTASREPRIHNVIKELETLL